MSKSQISETLFVSPTEFFKDKVNEASVSLKIVLGEDLEYYLVNLLCDFIKPEKVQSPLGEDQNILGIPLATILQKAQEAENSERKLAILKNLGDTSLYVAGYFQDYFNRKTFDISYYMEMGSLAYGSASQLARSRRDTAEVFAHLSENFPQLVDVVAEVSDDQPHRDNKNVLAIYDRWAKSNSDRLRKILLNLGIEPVPGITKIAQ